MSLSYPYEAELGGLKLSNDTEGTAVLMVLSTRAGEYQPDESFGVPVRPFRTLADIPGTLRAIESALLPYCSQLPRVSGYLEDDGTLTVECELINTNVQVTYDT